MFARALLSEDYPQAVCLTAFDLISKYVDDVSIFHSLLYFKPLKCFLDTGQDVIAERLSLIRQQKVKLIIVDEIDSIFSTGNRHYILAEIDKFASYGCLVIGSIVFLTNLFHNTQ